MPRRARLSNAGYLHMSIPHAAGALYSTTHDLLKWEQALFAGRIVSKASLETPAPTPPASSSPTTT